MKPRQPSIKTKKVINLKTVKEISVDEASVKRTDRLDSSDAHSDRPGHIGDAISLSVEDTLDMFEEKETNAPKNQSPKKSNVKVINNKTENPSEPTKSKVTDLRVQLYKRRRAAEKIVGPPDSPPPPKPKKRPAKHIKPPQLEDSLENAHVESTDEEEELPDYDELYDEDRATRTVMKKAPARTLGSAAKRLLLRGGGEGIRLRNSDRTESVIPPPKRAKKALSPPNPPANLKVTIDQRPRVSALSRLGEPVHITPDSPHVVSRSSKSRQVISPDSRYSSSEEEDVSDIEVHAAPVKALSPSKAKKKEKKEKKKKKKAKERKKKEKEKEEKKKQKRMEKLIALAKERNILREVESESEEEEVEEETFFRQEN